MTSEHAEKSGFATLQQGACRSDGTLSINNSEVTFEPLSSGPNLGRCQFNLNAIAGAKKCLGMGGGIIPVTGDAIRITLTDGKRIEFVLSNPDDWLTYLTPEPTSSH